VRVTAKAFDDGLVAQLKAQGVFHTRLRKQRHRLCVHQRGLAVHVGHIGKASLRQRQAAVLPASASSRKPMICSSLNRFFTSNLLSMGLDSKLRRYSNQGGRRLPRFESVRSNIGLDIEVRRRYHKDYSPVREVQSVP